MTRHHYFTRANKSKIMADFEFDNVVVRESLAQVQGRMDSWNSSRLRGLLPLLTDDNVTRVAGVTNPATAASATVETPVETVIPTNGNHQLVPADVNRLSAAYPWGIPQNFTTYFPNGGALFPHPNLISHAAARNTIFPWGVSTV